MSTIAHYDVPAADFALAETFRTVPETTVVCEQIVACSNTGVVPLIWVQTPDHAAVEEAFAHDPTVATFTPLDETGTAQLYRMEWATRVKSVLKMLTHAGATICDAAGRAEGWQLRVLYPDRDALRATYEFCADHNVTLDMRTVRTPDSDAHTQLGPGGSLTREQYDAIALAYKRGYFAVPRTATLEDLAEEMEISHQALSERLRRAHNALIGEALEMPVAEQGAAHKTRVPDGTEWADD
jgi:predicted DNA binding protein